MNARNDGSRAGRMAIAIVAASAIAVAAPACRRCSPAAAVGSRGSMQAGAGDEPRAPQRDTAPEPVPSALDVPVVAPSAPSPPALNTGPGADMSDGAAAPSVDSALREFVQTLTTTGVPFRQAFDALPAAARGRVTDPGVNYLRCRSIREPRQCERLEGSHREHCVTQALQVAARGRADRGWYLVPPLQAACRQFVSSDADCSRYGEAIETGDAQRCVGLRPELNDCPALAAGDASMCDRIPGVDRSCRRLAVFVRLLRGGLSQLAQTTDPNSSALGAGLNADASTCATRLHTALGLAPGGAAHPAANPIAP